MPLPPPRLPAPWASAAGHQLAHLLPTRCCCCYCWSAPRSRVARTAQSALLALASAFRSVASSMRYSRLRKWVSEWLESDISHVREVE